MASEEGIKKLYRSASWISKGLRAGCLGEYSLGTLPQGARSRLRFKNKVYSQPLLLLAKPQ